ncbi:MAG: NADH-quinone oxidoreductase subunit NuoK [Candidatus Aquicultor secundus]|uniref:NADH-quinone oxidoreductase subunit K n=1 Tax=Candidatus Aquicultor secundus TaxID=1973895 RepID=A0A2M7T8V5_9ACTN|nr:NADH-quinone oxidoreductase subunit NuoK [Candidatus Aquicultor secundus]NCO65077.1 NADH-quinone oxidoreductase subunit NuoK [Solirubrobacter sp.]OIO83898.1 MAG: NADH-quinone oxidoreductase subunit K [Candidatus Aquicultor secundus]PIU27320.1 MAG: NADH-quinone oxidoreductase subunit NuoK [Candidatus Aquicultor secundus]PIW21883.1 MAG: NADH-quinone oxidoreductase subunit NuoK [Candidatus Aquicultor secundus]PIX52004.1 MAG: NADH-quinone oxidoreductase subunit NuoK [Candidatus Aquicultor secun
MNVPLEWWLILSAVLFGIGLIGVLLRRNAVMILLSVELMLNASNLNLVAFSRYITPNLASGQMFALFVMAVAAAEVAVGLAIILSIYRNVRSVDLDDFNIFRW